VSDEQHDDHIWLVANDRPWAIAWIDGDLFGLWRGFVPNIEYTELDVSAVNWARYCDKAAALLEESE
jgi:hypothetical protein